MSVDFWNERFGEVEYAYGKEPNIFLKNFLENIPKGDILFPAEGEGRNAVYAAKKGFNVFCFDPSVEGQKKALELAKEAGVEIEYELASYESYETDKKFDSIVLVFAHMPPQIREKIHNKLVTMLKEGGHLFLVGYSKAQLELGTGGPKDMEMLYDEKIIRRDFSALEEKVLILNDVTLNEGKYHDGQSSVYVFHGIK